MIAVNFICPDCGSEDVLCDAFAAWDIESQEWVLHNIYPESPTVCNSCGEPSSYDECRVEK